MDDEAVIFDMVLDTNSVRFLAWFFDYWAMSCQKRIIYDNVEYTIDLDYLEPSEEFERATHEIEFKGMPFPTTSITELHKDGSRPKVMGLGFMSVIDIALEKIHIQAQNNDYPELDYFFSQIGKQLAHYYSPIKIYIKGGFSETPKEPSPAAQLDEWFTYYHECKDANIHLTLKDIAQKTTHHPDTIRKAHAIFMKHYERKKKNPNTPQN